MFMVNTSISCTNAMDLDDIDKSVWKYTPFWIEFLCDKKIKS